VDVAVGGGVVEAAVAVVVTIPATIEIIKGIQESLLLASTIRSIDVDTTVTGIHNIVIVIHRIRICGHVALFFFFLRCMAMVIAIATGCHGYDDKSDRAGSGCTSSSGAGLRFNPCVCQGFSPPWFSL
jgi:hypothetical protein